MRKSVKNIKIKKRKTRKNKIQRGGLPAHEVRDRITDEIMFYNRPQIVRELLQSAEDNFDINHVFNGYTLLSLAADYGRVDIVKILLENEADPNRVSDFDIATSSLVKAAERGHADVVEVLLKKGANVRHLDVMQHSSIWYAIDNQNYDIARRLIRAAFLQAAVNGNVYTEENATQDRVLGQGNPDVEEYFYKNFIIYNQDNNPDQPLPTLPPILKDEAASYVGGKTRKNKIQRAGGKWFPDEEFAKAIKEEDIENIQHDIKSGVDINERLPGMTHKPIHVAVNTGNLDIVKLLLDNGASINMKDTDGYTPLHHAANRKKLEDPNSMEINAKLIDIVNLLIDRGANLNVDSISDDTPLDLAARNGDLEMVDLLINRGANLLYSEKALHYASEKGHLPMVKYLVKRGYPVNRIIGGIYTETPLDRAVSKDHYDVVRYLVVVGGANINADTLNRIGHFELNSPSDRLKIAKFLIRAVVKEGKGDVRLEDIKYSRPVRELYIEALNIPKLEGTKIPKEMSKFDYRGGKKKKRTQKRKRKRKGRKHKKTKKRSKI
jgi:ankyrin repeat protein